MLCGPGLPGEQNYPETLRTCLAPLEGKIPPGAFLMEKARTLGGHGGQKCRDALPGDQYQSQTRFQGGAGGPARQARTRGNPGAAYRKLPRP